MSPISSTATLEEFDLAYEPAERIAASLQQVTQALEAARQEGDSAALATVLVRMARLRFRLGQYDQARHLAAEALNVAAPDARSRTDAFQVLANCASEVGSLAEAEAHYRAAADLAREIGYPYGRVAAIHGLATQVCLLRGQFDLTLATEEEARRIASEQGQEAWLVCPLITMAMIGQLTGRRAQAQAALAELSRLAVSGSTAQGYHLSISASLALDEGELATARTLFGRARSIAEASGEPWLNVSVRLGFSRLHRLAGEGPAAHVWADDALSYARHIGYRHEQGKALIERGRAAWLCADEASAEADLRAAEQILTGLGASLDLARARLLLAALLHQQNRSDALAAWLDAAQAIVTGGYAFLLEQERELAFPLLAAWRRKSDPTLDRWCTALLDGLSRVPPPMLRVNMLGRWEVWKGSHCIAARALRQRRAGELLALLLLAPGRRLSSDQVAEALFPEKDPTAAQVLFHHATSALRRILQPDLPDRFPSGYLSVEEGSVALILPPGSQVDVELFENHCRDGEWQQALALYEGDLLPDYRYDEWALAPRERLAQLYQRALLRLAEGRWAEGCYAEALDACQRLLAVEPWHEQAVLLGMRASIALHDLAGARRLYLKLEKALRNELQTAPQAEVQALYRSLTPSAE